MSVGSRVRLGMMESPPLPDSDHGQCDYCANDEETDQRHCAIEVSPPPGALVSRLVEDMKLVLVVDMAELA